MVAVIPVIPMAPVCGLLHPVFLAVGTHVILVAPALPCVDDLKTIGHNLWYCVLTNYRAYGALRGYSRPHRGVRLHPAPHMY